MWQAMGIAILSAALSSVFTLALAAFVYQRYLAARLEARLEHIAANFGALMEAHVREGVREGVISLSSAQTLRDTTRQVTKTGAELVEDGLLSLFGGRRKPPKN